MSITFESIKKLEDLKTSIEKTTGLSHKNLTNAVQALKDKEAISIATPEDLIAFSNAVNSGRVNLCAVLENDIDMSSVQWINNLSSYAIGTPEHHYCGIFDGQGYTIYGLNMKFHNVIGTGSEDINRDIRLGLFGTVNQAIIKNVIVDGTITFSGRMSYNSKIGGLVGYAENSSFERCINKVAISFNHNPGNDQRILNVGGLIGYASCIHMDKCGNEASHNLRAEYFGGLVGYLADTEMPSAITKSYNHGDFDGYKFCGGLVGYLGGCSHKEPLHDIVFDFKQLAKELSEQEFWDDLCSDKCDENTRYIGSRSSAVSMTDEQKSAYSDVRDYILSTRNWTIDETVSNFSSRYYNKRIFMNHSDDVPWGICFVPYYQSKDSSRSKLAFTVNVPEGKSGKYSLYLKSYKTISSSGTDPVTGIATGGGRVNLQVNGNTVYEDYSFIGNNITDEEILTYVVLNEGINSLVIDAVYNYGGTIEGGRCYLCLSDLVLSKLDDIEIIKDKEVEIILDHQNNPLIPHSIIENGVSSSTDNTVGVSTYVNEHNNLFIKGLRSKEYAVISVLDSLGKIVYMIAASVVSLEESKYTTYIVDCYNSGNYDSHSSQGTAYHHSAGLFGMTQTPSIWIKNCYTSGYTPEDMRDEDGDGVLETEWRDNAIYANCNSCLVGSYNNVYYLEGASRAPYNPTGDIASPDDHYEDIAISLHDHMIQTAWFANKLGDSFILADEYPILFWEKQGEVTFDQWCSDQVSCYYNNTLTKLIPHMFYSKKSLLAVNFPKVLNSASGNIFNGAANLISANLPQIKGSAYSAIFSYCYNLKSVNIPNITVLISQSFKNCSSLTYLYLPSLVSINGSDVFQLSGLNTLILANNAKVCSLTSSSAFADTPIANKTGYIYVPKSLIESYKTATNWSVYADQFRAIEDYPNECWEVYA